MNQSMRTGKVKKMMMESRSDMKKCFKCGEIKPISEFYKHSKMGDGHLGKCKSCCKKDVSANYRKNRDHYQEYEAARGKTKSRIENKLVYTKTHRAKYPERYIARCAVNNAVRDGRLKKTPCEVCGSEDAEAHHEDYSRPLDVVWLCRKHHVLLHGKVPFE